MEINLRRINNACQLEAVNDTGNTVIIDGSPDIGGQNLGMRPMQLLLVSLAGCSSMDVLSILAKKRQQVSDFQVKISGEREAGTIPALFRKIHLHFTIKGQDIAPEKVERAIQLSMEKYCSVAKTLEPTAQITTSFDAQSI